MTWIQYVWAVWTKCQIYSYLDSSAENMLPSQLQTGFQAFEKSKLHPFCICKETSDHYFTWRLNPELSNTYDSLVTLKASRRAQSPAVCCGKLAGREQCSPLFLQLDENRINLARAFIFYSRMQRGADRTPRPLGFQMTVPKACSLVLAKVDSTLLFKVVSSP